MTLPTGDWLFYLVGGAYSAISVLLWILIL